MMVISGYRADLAAIHRALAAYVAALRVECRVLSEAARMERSGADLAGVFEFEDRYVSPATDAKILAWSALILAMASRHSARGGDGRIPPPSSNAIRHAALRYRAARDRWDAMLRDAPPGGVDEAILDPATDDVGEAFERLRSSATAAGYQAVAIDGRLVIVADLARVEFPPDFARNKILDLDAA